MAMTVVYYCRQGQILAENRIGTVTHLIPDTLGNVIETRDEAWNKTSETTYWPCGEVRTQTGANPTPREFVGTRRYLDQSVYAVYVCARWLIPRYARWISFDPYWPNEPPYNYMSGNPTGTTDWSGLSQDQYDPWVDWVSSCAGSEDQAIHQGYSKLIRKLASLCGSRRRDYKSVYKKCLEDNGMSGADADKVANCLCEVQSGQRKVRIICRPPNAFWRTCSNGMGQEKDGRGRIVNVVPGFGESHDGDWYGRAFTHEIGHCCGRKDKAPGKAIKPPNFDNEIHDKCLGRAIGWSWLV